MAHRVSMKRRAPRTTMERRRAARASLTASGGVAPIFDLAQYPSHVVRLYHDKVVSAGHTMFDGASWPTSAPGLTDNERRALVATDGQSSLLALEDGSLVKVDEYHGFISLSVAASTSQRAAEVVTAFRASHPVLTLEIAPDSGELKVPITFWTNGVFGPSSRMRMIAAQAWEEIAGNYPLDVREQLDAIMDGYMPDGTGQLHLWQGPPGTGKTWGLRALASAWASWAEFHYITDPDTFFVDNPSYMIDVLLSDSYAMIEPESGALVEEADPEAKWRVLILEDTGELLAANAKEKYGQGLSRLLNVVDGMIGQGLKVLCVVTTNDELGDLNPAVLRPGRCASQVVFRQLTAEEAAEWGEGDVDAEVSLAELYAKRNKGKPAFDDDETEEVVAAASVDVAAEVRKIAEAHQQDATGYGECAWNADTATVLYVCGDWTDPEPVERDMLAIPGVKNFVYEFEGMPDGWCQAELLYPNITNEKHWLVAPCREQEASLEEILRLAMQPLGEQERSDDSALTAAIGALAAAHNTTVDSITALVRSAAKGRGQGRGDHIALTALGVLSQFAQKPAPAPSPITVKVDVPEREQHFTIEGAKVSPHIDVTLPEQPPAQVDVHMGDQHIDVHVPAQEPAQIDVHVPAPEPTVLSPHFEVHVPEQQRQSPRRVTVGFDEEGNKVYTSEDVDE